MRRGILLILKGRAFGFGTLQQNTVSVSLQPDDNALRATTAIGAAGYKPTETKSVAFSVDTCRRHVPTVRQRLALIIC